MTLLIAFSNLMLLAAGILFFVTPEMSRPGTLFGVTVVPEFVQSDSGRALLQRYRRRVAVATLVVILVTNLGFAITPGFMFPIGLALEGIAAIACWVRASKEARGFAHAVPSVRMASLNPHLRELPGGWLFLIGPYLVLALAGWFLYSNWNAIPESFAHRTIPGVFWILLGGLFSNALTTMVACMVVFRTRNFSSPGGDPAGDRAFKRATYFLMMAISYLMSLVFAVLSTRSVWAGSSGASLSPMLPVLLTFGVSVAAVVYLVRISRSRKGSTGDGTPDACWRWGLFYYNPDDPSLLVEKRMGLGWTLNFANRWSWALIAVMLLPALIILAVAN